MKLLLPIATFALVAVALVTEADVSVRDGNRAFWTAAAAPSTLYTPLDAQGEESPLQQAAWCDGQGQPSCAPAAPVSPHQSVSFSDAPVAVLTDLRLHLAPEVAQPPPLDRTVDAREGVRARVERPPRS